MGQLVLATKPKPLTMTALFQSTTQPQSTGITP